MITEAYVIYKQKKPVAGVTGDIFGSVTLPTRDISPKYFRVNGTWYKRVEGGEILDDVFENHLGEVDDEVLR